MECYKILTGAELTAAPGIKDEKLGSNDGVEQ